MADVTGVIGNEQVELNNAATEATLRLLLQATLSANRQSLSAIQNLARQSGVSSSGSVGATIANTNNAFFNAGRAVGSFTSNIGQTSGLLKEFINNTAETSSVLRTMGSVNGPLGGFLTILAKAAEYQESNLKTYQQISTVGANFGGSLTDMRLAATNTYMTLAEFGAVVTSNAQTLAKMGAGVDNGTRAFVALSKGLISSETGRNLLALGYTTKDVNEGMLKYIEATGARSTAELKNVSSTKQITESSAAYMENLDALARVTGKSRDAIQAEMDAASKNAAWQAQLQSMSEIERSKAMLGMQNALALGGKGAVDAFQSKIMGIAPDKAGQMFIATAGNMAAVVDKSADMVTDANKDSSDMRKTLKEGLLAAKDDMGKYSKESMMAIIRAGGPLADAIQQMGITANRVDKLTDSEIDNLVKKQVLANSEAKMMTDANANLKDFSQALIGMISPIVSMLTPAIHLISKVFAVIGDRVTAALKEFDKLGEGTGDLVKTIASSVALLAAGYGVLKLFGGGSAARSAGSGAGSVLSGLGSGAGGGIGGLMRGVAGGLSAFANPAVMIGVAGFSAAILGIGAAIAGASWLTGAALPKLADGLSKIQELNGENLMSVAKGAGAFGLSLMAFVPSALLIFPAALGVNMLADGLLKMNKVDTNQLLKVAEAMERVNAATPSVGQTLKSGFSNIVGKITGATAEATAGQVTTSSPTVSDSSAVVAELKKLNVVSGELLRNIRDSVEYSRRNLDATRALSGNLFPTN